MGSFPKHMCALSGAALAVHTAAAAQTIDPPIVRPDRERFEPPTRIIGDPPPAVVQSFPQDTPPGAETTAIVLRNVVIGGDVSVFTREELLAYFSPYLGKEVSVATLFERAQAIENAYRERGFVTSRVIVPAQRIADGEFRILVIEGSIDSVEVSGDIGPTARAIRGMGSKITDDHPIAEQAIERFTLLVNDLPGISGQTVIRPAARAGATGASDVEFVADRKKIDAFVAIDNRGSVLTGPWAIFAGASFNSFTPFAEQLQISLYSTADFDEQKVGQVSYSQQVGSSGLRAGASVAVGKTKTGGPLAGFGFESDTFAAALFAEYPLVRSEEFSLWTGLAAGVVNSDTDRPPLPPEGPGRVAVFSDRTRTVSVNARWRAVLSDRGGWGSAAAGSIELTRGFAGLGATDDIAITGAQNRSRVDGEAAFTRLSGEVLATQDVPGPLQFFGRLGGQWSADPLLAIEEYQIGAQRFGRAYEPAQLTGDSALGATIEIQADLKEIDALGRALGEQIDGAMLYAFTDVGAAWNKDVNGADALVSAGAGLRLRVLEHIAVDFEAAIPVNEDVRFDPDSDVEFFVRVAVFK